jgi:4'-phosphopantetheinyl transferase
VAADVVHVWRIALTLPAHALRELGQILAPDERARAERFLFSADRERFIAARGTLRLILGAYLACAPGEVRFRYGPHGKPALAGEPQDDPPRFNLSHSGDLALYAVTRGREVGIDVERTRPDIASETIAEQFFSPREVATLRALPVHLQEKAFFACWTRKEAYIKATGRGLAIPLASFDVTLAPGEQPALVSTRNDPREAARWRLCDLDAGAGYAAALAVEGHDWRLACWQAPGP